LPQGSPAGVPGGRSQFSAIGEDAGGSRFADASGPREQVSVRDAPLRHGAPQRGRDVVLDDEIGELFGTVLPSQSNHWENLLSWPSLVL